MYGKQWMTPIYYLPFSTVYFVKIPRGFPRSDLPQGLNTINIFGRAIVIRENCSNAKGRVGYRKHYRGYLFHKSPVKVNGLFGPGLGRQSS